MATGITSSITGTQSYSSVLEFTTYDDTLTVINATLNLLLPAGDIEMMQGADTLIVGLRPGNVQRGSGGHFSFFPSLLLALPVAIVIYIFKHFKLNDLKSKRA